MATMIPSTASRAGARLDGSSLRGSSHRHGRRWWDSPPPLHAVAVGVGQVVAAQRAAQGPQIVATRVEPLAPGVLAMEEGQLRVREGERLSMALRSALSGVGGEGEEIILLLPESTARVTRLEFEHLPRAGEQVRELLLFRLRKSLPYDAGEAELSWQKHGDEHHLLTLVGNRHVLNEYEDAAEAAGARAVSVLPAALTALVGLPSQQQGTLLLQGDTVQCTAAFLWDDRLQFYRTTPAGPSGQVEFDDLYQALAYYRDFLASREEGEDLIRPRIIAAGLAEDLIERLRSEAEDSEVLDADRLRGWLPAPLDTHAAEGLALTGAFLNAF